MVNLFSCRTIQNSKSTKNFIKSTETTSFNQAKISTLRPPKPGRDQQAMPVLSSGFTNSQNNGVLLTIHIPSLALYQLVHLESKKAKINKQSKEKIVLTKIKCWPLAHTAKTTYNCSKKSLKSCGHFVIFVRESVGSFGMSSMRMSI